MSQCIDQLISVGADIASSLVVTCTVYTKSLYNYLSIGSWGALGYTYVHLLLLESKRLSQILCRVFHTYAGALRCLGLFEVSLDAYVWMSEANSLGP